MLVCEGVKNNITVIKPSTEPGDANSPPSFEEGYLVRGENEQPSSTIDVLYDLKSGWSRFGGAVVYHNQFWGNARWWRYGYEFCQ